MVQVLPASNKWATAGHNFGQGISEQIPKEVEHYRLSQGLKELGKQKNLTPMEFATQAASVYGMTPEMHRQFGQLAREQGNKNAYRNLSSQGENVQQPEERGFNRDEFTPPKVGSSGKPLRNIKPGVADTGIQRIENEKAINPREENKPSVVDRNPTAKSQEYVPNWTPQQRINERAKISTQFPQFTPEQIDNMANANEEAYKSLSEAERKNYDRQEQIKDAVDNKFEKAVRNRLEIKKDEPIFTNNISGANYENAKRELEKDIKNNPNKNIDEQVAKWSQHLLDFADKKQEMKTLAERGLYSYYFNNSETLKSLKSYQEAFDETGNLKEFNDILRKDPKDGGFGMSNMGAASLTYPVSKSIKDQINSMPRIKSGNRENDSRNFAKQIVDKGLGDQSPLAIAQEAQMKDPFFDVVSFLDYFADNKKSIPMLEHQKQDVEARLGPPGGYWGDYFILPNKRNEK